MTDKLPPAVTATDMRLDAILAELRGLRADMDAAPVGWRQRLDRAADAVAALGDAPVTVELREPETSAAPLVEVDESPKPARKRR